MGLAQSHTASECQRRKAKLTLSDFRSTIYVISLNNDTASDISTTPCPLQTPSPYRTLQPGVSKEIDSEKEKFDGQDGRARQQPNWDVNPLLTAQVFVLVTQLPMKEVNVSVPLCVH